METTQRSAFPQTSKAQTFASFQTTDWGLLGSCALMWGSSFLFIEEGLEALAPAVVTSVRLLLGFTTLLVFKRARRPLDRKDLPRTSLVGVFWMALPLALFPIAQQHIDSSVAGMINGSVPVFAVIVARLMSKTIPPQAQVAGIGIGLFGILLITAPEALGVRATALGIVLALVATISYAVAINLTVSLQQRYGAMPVLLRAQAVAIALTAIPGAIGLQESRFAWSSALAMLPLGCLSTGLAFVAMTTLAGRVGPGAASVTGYFLPVVAVFLGVALRGEEVTMWAVLGTGAVIAGAGVVGASSSLSRRTRSSRA